MKLKYYFLLSVFVALFLLLTGCNRQSYVSVGDSRVIAKDAPVIWYEGDAYVGKVAKVKQTDGRYQIYIDFQKSYEKSIHAGVRACPLVEPKISHQPILLLVGGKDDTMPLLEPGSQIPEITLEELQRMKQLNFWEWFGKAKMNSTLVLAGLILVLCVVCLLKIVAKLLKFAILVAILVLVASYVFDLSGDWKQYQEQASQYVKGIKLEEVQEWMQKHYSEWKDKIPGLVQNLKLLNSDSSKDGEATDETGASGLSPEAEPQK